VESMQHDEEPELPHIELGVAEVEVAPRSMMGGGEGGVVCTSLERAAEDVYCTYIEEDVDNG
jgi:hypothetical protein